MSWLALAVVLAAVHELPPPIRTPLLRSLHDMHSMSLHLHSADDVLRHPVIALRHTLLECVGAFCWNAVQTGLCNPLLEGFVDLDPVEGHMPHDACCI